jgi:dihydrofolate reductase
MRKVIVSTLATLDGRVEHLQEWALPFDHEAAAEYHTELLSNSDGLLLGRRTYQVFATIWPPRAGTVPYADQINRMPKYVSSGTLADLEWENSHLIPGDVAKGVAELKQEPGNDLVVYGGMQFIRTLQEHDLVDEYRILVHPVLLGKGRIFHEDGAGRVDLDLVDSTVMSTGVSVLTYRPVR